MFSGGGGEGEGKGGRYVGPTLPPSCSECLEIWEHQLPETLCTRPGIALPCYIRKINTNNSLWLPTVRLK